MLIRTATPADICAIAAVEAACFPPAEAASPTAIESRLNAFPEHFWLLEDEGELIAFVNGMTTDELHLRDAMYEQASLHDASGAWQMIFGVDTMPARRGQGWASHLLRHAIAAARADGRKGVVLTCKDGLVPFYARFGFVDEGICDSTHGGVAWHEMRLTF